MSIYAISDLHLSSVNPKPMDIFGQNWVNHWDSIRNDWLDNVKETDTVLIPGDISWAITLEEALPDILDISKLPGRKIMIRGNHDYWWESVGKIKKVLPPCMDIIQNDFIDVGDFNICGTRGWLLPDDERFQERDRKIFNRELIRLDLSLAEAARNSTKQIIVMIHYPPFNEKNKQSEFVSVMNKYNVKICIYGHLHGDSLKNVIDGIHNSIQFYMVSCDFLNFKLKRIG